MTDSSSWSSLTEVEQFGDKDQSQFSPIVPGGAESSGIHDAHHGRTSWIAASDRNELDRIMTTYSAITDGGVLPDPQGDNFDQTKWLQAFVKEFLEQGHAPKEVGISYQNLTVSGNGAALRLQSTLGSLFSTPFRLGESFSLHKKAPRAILRNFDGILQPGELLIVLGRPGSGCSTLLKAMCGELHGLQVDDNSVIHYNGVPQKQMVREFQGEIAYNQEVPHLSTRNDNG